MSNKVHISTEKKVRMKRCRQINALFDAVEHECGLRVQEIFVQAYGSYTKESRNAKVHFLKNVHDCPERVEKFCQQLLQKKTLRKGGLK